MQSGVAIVEDGDGRAGWSIGVVIGLLILAVSGLGGTIARGAPSDVEMWWRIFEDGGILEVATDAGEFAIPVEVSSVLAPEPDEGDPSNETVVLRGQAAGSTAAVILESDRAGAIVNTADGSFVRIEVPPTEESTNETRENRTVKRNVSDPLRGGPLQIEQHSVKGDLPPLPEYSADATNESAQNSSLQGMTTLHARPPGGNSIHISKHIWDSDNPIDPVNALFYDLGTRGWIRHTMEGSHGVGWNKDVCGSDKYAWFYDGMHGGSDGWQLQDRHWGKEDDWCLDSRYHFREFNSDSGDSHSPGFAEYSPAPAHWECDGHDLECVDPQRGQDELLVDLRYSHDVDHIWMNQIDHSDGECATCPRWDGWVDFYQIWSVSGQDPCGDDSPTETIYSGSVDTVRWEC